MSTTLREDSTLASYTPDIADEIDGANADLIERFAEVAKGWHGLAPTTRLAFEKVVVDIFVRALEGGLLDRAVEAGRTEAYSLAAVAMMKVVGMLTEHHNPKMLAACLKFAIGTEPRSETAVAADFGVDKATISKWACRFVDVLNLIPGRGMRRPKARQAYSDRQAKVWQDRFDQQRQEAA